MPHVGLDASLSPKPRWAARVRFREQDLRGIYLIVRDERITYREAAEILGCHVSNVPKLVRKGHLTSRSGGNQHVPAFAKGEVDALVQRRNAERATRAVRAPKLYESVLERPDDEHEWLAPREVGKFLGISRQAASRRIARAKIPSMAVKGRRWVRADHF